MTATSLLGMAFMVLGAILIAVRASASRKSANLYRRWGIEVPEDKYAKQFVFIGLLLIILGFLISTGLMNQI